MSSVTGVFDNATDADKAVNRLLNDGFPKENIRLVVSDADKSLKPWLATAPAADTVNHVAEGGFMGAAMGSALGALLASITTFGSIMLPGGSVLMAGPIVAALAGAGAGGIVGGFSGVIIGAGFALDEANRYEDDINAGKSVVVVTTTDEIKEARARIALRGLGAVMRVA